MSLGEEKAHQARIALRTLQDAQLCLYQAALRRRALAQVRRVARELLESSAAAPGNERTHESYAQLQLLKYLFGKYWRAREPWIAVPFETLHAQMLQLVAVVPDLVPPSDRPDTH